MQFFINFLTEINFEIDCNQFLYFCKNYSEWKTR